MELVSSTLFALFLGTLLMPIGCRLVAEFLTLVASCLITQANAMEAYYGVWKEAWKEIRR